MKQNGAEELDRLDIRILSVLQEDATLSAAEIAEKVGTATATCWRRMQKLERDGLVRARVALLNRERLGMNLMVFAHVKLANHGRDSLARFEQAVRSYPEVLECYTLLGETDFLLRIVTRDIKAYEAFFLDHLSRIAGLQSVSSSIALSIIKETTSIPLVAPAAASRARRP
jgi:Lrp/AsnC family transcriptional regulator